MPAKTPTEEVSKNTKDIVAVLKKMSQNDSTEEKKENTEKEKENIKKDEVNLLAWGKLGKNFSNSVSEMSKERKKQSGFFKGTIKLATGLFENAYTSFESAIKNVYSTLVSNIREVLGPVAGIFDIAFDFIKGAFNYIKKTYLALMAWRDHRRNKYLKSIEKYAKDTFKLNQRNSGTSGKQKKPPFQTILLGIGILIGTIAAIILAPFRLLLTALMKIKPIALAIENLFGESSKFGMILKNVKARWNVFKGSVLILGESFRTMGEAGKFFGKIFRGFIKIIKFGGKFLKPLTIGLKFGFKTLGWPLTILLGAIDAIKGFMKTYTGDNLGEALIAGLKAAFMGFLDGFVGLFTWVTGKILGWGPEKTAKVYDKIMKTISDVFDSIFEWVGDLTAGIKKMFTKDYWKDMWKKVKEGPPDTVVRPADKGNTLFGYNNQVVEKRTEANRSTKKDNKELLSQFELNKQALTNMNRLLNEQNKNTGDTLQQIIQSNSIKNEAPQIREDLGPAAFGIAIENEEFG